jgi:hypothetical protein
MPTRDSIHPLNSFLCHAPEDAIPPFDSAPFPTHASENAIPPFNPPPISLAHVAMYLLVVSRQLVTTQKKICI